MARRQNWDPARGDAGFELLSEARRGSFSYLLENVRGGTSEVQQLLKNECDIVLECRVCRNFFRKLEDFVTHKESYCAKAFDLKKKNGGVAQFITHSEFHPGFRSKKEFYDEIDRNLQRSAEELNPIQLHLRPLVNQGNQVIVCQDVVNEGATTAVATTIMNSWHVAKKDTAVLDITGKICGTGTDSAMAVLANQVGAKMEQLKKMGEVVEAPNFKIRTLMCKTCKLICSSKAILAIHEGNCERYEKLQLARRPNFAAGGGAPSQPECSALSPGSTLTSGEEVEVENISSEDVFESE